MKKIVLGLVCFLWGSLAGVQAQNCTCGTGEKYIEVTGTAEQSVEPDEIHLWIGIEEYWKEEFEKKTEFKDYHTKVPLAEIEKEVLASLAKVGVTKKDILVHEAGNYSRYKGKDFLFSKQLDVTLYDFDKVDNLIHTLTSRGINHMSIGELKNKKLASYRMEVKKEALKAAYEKAGYLLESVGKQLGSVISIEELPDEVESFRPQRALSNVTITDEGAGIDSIKKIRLRYSIKAKFSIQ
ncbi:SIMPL domain-containing protein [Parabacteroides pacaensis]|uniref:SIMPL domain-containing protein n=1 Tax=Parabacteroides pacaensis TaxID=2086575 RepID=UPI000D1067C4|nr:SIMPL domain-containing protein [Parabacteroides pacaensis]